MDFTTESAEHTEKSLRAWCFFHSLNSGLSMVNMAVFRQVDGSMPCGIGAERRELSSVIVPAVRLTGGLAPFRFFAHTPQQTLLRWTWQPIYAADGSAASSARP